MIWLLFLYCTLQSTIKLDELNYDFFSENIQYRIKLESNNSHLFNSLTKSNLETDQFMESKLYKGDVFLETEKVGWASLRIDQEDLEGIVTIGGKVIHLPQEQRLKPREIKTCQFDKKRHSIDIQQLLFKREVPDCPKELRELHMVSLTY